MSQRPRGGESDIYYVRQESLKEESESEDINEDSSRPRSEVRVPSQVLTPEEEEEEEEGDGRSFTLVVCGVVLSNYGKVGVRLFKSNLGPLHTQAQSRDHGIVRAQRTSLRRPSQHTSM